MKARTLGRSVAVVAALAAGYAVWLRVEEARAQRSAWAEVTDPVEAAEPMEVTEPSGA